MLNFGNGIGNILIRLSNKTILISEKRLGEEVKGDSPRNPTQWRIFPTAMSGVINRLFAMTAHHYYLRFINNGKPHVAFHFLPVR